MLGSIHQYLVNRSKNTRLLRGWEYWARGLACCQVRFPEVTFRWREGKLIMLTVMAAGSIVVVMVGEPRRASLIEACILCCTAAPLTPS
jgi:hypothetical protein